MLRLHSERSRSYPGRPARHAAVVTAALCVATATCRVFEQESAEAIVGAGNHHTGGMVLGNEPGE